MFPPSPPAAPSSPRASLPDTPPSPFSSLLLFLRVFLHGTAPSRAQCEIAAPALHEEAPRVPGGNQG
eukprot:885632-Pyramimonas_sp.AAC.1